MNDLNYTNEDFANLIGEMENEAAKGTFKNQYWKPETDGTFKLRIITPLKQFGEKLFYQKRKMHYINGRAYFCLNQELTDKNGNLHTPEICPICGKAKAIYQSSQKGTEDWNIAGSLRAKDRFVSRVIVRGKKDSDGNDSEAKPEFWEFGQKIYDYFFNAIKMGEYGNFLSMKEGRDYNLCKKGSGRNTSYDGSMLSLQQSPIFSDVEKLKKLQEELPKMNYAQLVEFVSPAEMKRALNEMFNSVSTDEFSNQTVNTTTPEADNLNPFAQSAPAVDNTDSQNIDDILASF